jgi:hypothetical protein
MCTPSTCSLSRSVSDHRSFLAVTCECSSLLPFGIFFYFFSFSLLNSFAPSVPHPDAVHCSALLLSPAGSALLALKSYVPNLANLILIRIPRVEDLALSQLHLLLLQDMWSAHPMLQPWPDQVAPPGRSTWAATNCCVRALFIGNSSSSSERQYLSRNGYGAMQR